MVVLRDIDIFIYIYGCSKNNGTPKSSILIGFSIINHPFWGINTPIFGNTHIYIYIIDIFFIHKYYGEDLRSPTQSLRVRREFYDF